MEEFDIAIWHKGSTNYGANKFVKSNGTGNVKMTSEAAALQYMSALIQDPQIDSVVINGPVGRLAWVRHDDEVDGTCSCSECVGEE